MWNTYKVKHFEQLPFVKFLSDERSTLKMLDLVYIPHIGSTHHVTNLFVFQFLYILYILIA